MDSARTAEITRGRISARRMHDALSAYLFISPSALIITVFGIFPLFFTVYVSLFKWRLTRGSFFGLGNYQSLFGNALLPLLAFGASIAGFALAAFLLRKASGLRLPGGLLILAG